MIKKFDESFTVGNFRYETYKCLFGNGFRFRVLEEDEAELKSFANWLNSKILPQNTSDKFPEETDCDDDHRCWFEHPNGNGWMLVDRVYAFNNNTRWLPHYALPATKGQSI